MCNLGGIVLIKKKRKWKIEEWKHGKAPNHDHFFLEPGFVNEQGYPVLEKFPDGSGILIGWRLRALKEELRNPISVFFLDGIKLLENG
jgi:hypothetical protein